MTTKNIAAVLIALVVAGGVYGGYKFLFSPAVQQVIQSVGSPAGSTFSSAKVAQINFTPTDGATSTSILNTDSSDRYIMDQFADCANATTSYTAVTGTGLASLIFKAATTSTNAPAVIANANTIMNLNIATGTITEAPGAITATPDSLTLSTSSPGASAFKARWQAGSYLTFWSNATNTMQCTIGVHYLAS